MMPRLWSHRGERRAELARLQRELTEVREQMTRLESASERHTDELGEHSERLDLADAIFRQRLGLALRATPRSPAPPPPELVDAATRVTSEGGEVTLTVDETPVILCVDPEGGDPEEIWRWVQGVAPSFRPLPAPTGMAS